MGSLSLLQGIFLTQGLNPGLPHWRRILYHLSHPGRLFANMHLQHQLAINRNGLVEGISESGKKKKEMLLFSLRSESLGARMKKTQ